MALICLNPLTDTLTGRCWLWTASPARCNRERSPAFAGRTAPATTTTLRMPVELSRPTPGTPIIDRHTHLRAGPAIPGDGRDDRFGGVPPAARRTRHTARAGKEQPSDQPASHPAGSRCHRRADLRGCRRRRLTSRPMAGATPCSSSCTRCATCPDHCGRSSADRPGLTYSTDSVTAGSVAVAPAAGAAPVEGSSDTRSGAASEKNAIARPPARRARRRLRRLPSSARKPSLRRPLPHHRPRFGRSRALTTALTAFGSDRRAGTVRRPGWSTRSRRRHAGRCAVRAPLRIGPRGQAPADRAEREGQRWPGCEAAGRNRIVSGTSSPWPTEGGAPPIAPRGTIIGPAALPGRWGISSAGSSVVTHAAGMPAVKQPITCRADAGVSAAKVRAACWTPQPLTGMHPAVLAAPVVLRCGAVH